MKVIVLKGISSIGKSETLNIVYQFLLKDGYVQVPGHYRELGNKKYNDCIDILEKKDAKVGIAMMGDYEKYYKDAIAGDIVQDLLLYLDRNECDIAICACNSTLKIAESFIKDNFENEIIDKLPTTNLSERRIANGKHAENILEKLKSILSN